MDNHAWDRRYADSEFVWTVHPNRFLVEEAASLPPGRALDLACGEGRNAVWLSQRGWEVIGVDFSQAGLEKAQRHAAERGVHPEWIAADLLDYRPQPHAFDLVLIFYLQLPADQRGQVVHAAADGVAPAGTLLVVAHDRANLQDGHGGPQDPTVLYTAEDIIGDLAGSGLRVQRADRVRRPVQTPDGERVALDALLRATRA
jgi:2-polyprenyl-3-methyl-5-hydroxy-6-metoxy-1,4-benzoquinol methylase